MAVILLWVAVAFFGAGSVVGAVLLRNHVLRRPVPLSPAVMHGVFGALGLIFLTAAIVSTRRPEGVQVGQWPTIALAILGAAAAGGVVLFLFHVRGRPLPITLMGVHAAAAAVGVGLILVVLLVKTQTGAPVPLDPSVEPAPPPGAQPAPRASEPEGR